MLLLSSHILCLMVCFASSWVSMSMHRPISFVSSPQSWFLDVIVNLITRMLAILSLIKCIILMKPINTVHRRLLEILITWVISLLHYRRKVIASHLIIEGVRHGIEVRTCLSHITIDLWDYSFLLVERPTFSTANGRIIISIEFNCSFRWGTYRIIIIISTFLLDLLISGYNSF